MTEPATLDGIEIELDDQGRYQFPGLTRKDFEQIISDNAFHRRGNMPARAISEFGTFISEMRSYITFNTESSSEEYAEFQRTVVDREKWKTQDIASYFVLYQLYLHWWKSNPSEALKQIQEQVEDFIDEDSK